MGSIYVLLIPSPLVDHHRIDERGLCLSASHSLSVKRWLLFMANRSDHCSKHHGMCDELCIAEDKVNECLLEKTQGIVCNSEMKKET